MIKWKVDEKIEHFIELDEAVNTRNKVLRAFYKNEFKEFDKNKKG